MMYDDENYFDELMGDTFNSSLVPARYYSRVAIVSACNTNKWKCPACSSNQIQLLNFDTEHHPIPFQCRECKHKFTKQITQTQG